MIFIIALFSWPYIARIVRGNTLSIREKEFIEAARSLGAGNVRIMFREVLPNLVAPIIVYATLIIPSNILRGRPLVPGPRSPADPPSWGRMLADAAPIFEVAWWLMVFLGSLPDRDHPGFQPARRRTAGRIRSAERPLRGDGD